MLCIPKLTISLIKSSFIMPSALKENNFSSKKTEKKN